MTRRGFISFSRCLHPFHINLVLHVCFIMKVGYLTPRILKIFWGEQNPRVYHRIHITKSRLLPADIAIPPRSLAPSTSKLHHNLLAIQLQLARRSISFAHRLLYNCPHPKPHKSFQDSKPAVIQRTNSGHRWSQGIPRQFFP